MKKGQQRVHSDFETIERNGQSYRISTYVDYRVHQEDYRCRAKLYKQYGGKVRPENRMHRKSGFTSDKTEIDDVLEQCIESCKEKLDEIEDAKDVSVEVSITDE